MKSRVALVLSILLLVALPLLAAEDGRFDRTLKVTGPADVDVQTGSGSITVTGDSNGQVVVHAVIRANDNWMNWIGGGDIASRIKSIEDNPPIEQSGNTIRIGHMHDGDLRNISISYEIHTPRETTLHTRSGSGHQRVTNVNGPVDASTGSGGMEVSGVTSGARLQTGSGGIEMSDISGSVRARTGSGGIRGDKIGGYSSVNASAKFQGKALPLASAGTTGPGAQNAYLEFEAGSGHIRLQNIAGSLRASTGSGGIDAEGRQMGDWDLRTGSGGVSVQLPQNSKFSLNARTNSGSVSSDFPVTAQGTMSRHELVGSVNGGGPRLDIRTGSGGIRIEK